MVSGYCFFQCIVILAIITTIIFWPQRREFKPRFSDSDNKAQSRHITIEQSHQTYPNCALNDQAGGCTTPPWLPGGLFYQMVSSPCSTRLILQWWYLIIWRETLRPRRHRLNLVWLWHFFVFVWLIAFCQSSGRGLIIASCHIRAHTPSGVDTSVQTLNPGAPGVT